MAKTARSFEKQVPLYYRSLDFKALWRDYPPAPDYFESTYQLEFADVPSIVATSFLQHLRRSRSILPTEFAVPLPQAIVDKLQHYRKTGALEE